MPGCESSTNTTIASPQVTDADHWIFERIAELRLPLINRFYSECEYSVKCGRLDRVYSMSTTHQPLFSASPSPPDKQPLSSRIIAAARLLPQPEGDFLLRNLCVSPSHRQQGVATALIKSILLDLAPSHCYCFALPHLEHFYLNLEFAHLSSSQVPASIAVMHERNQLRKRGWLLMGR